MKPCWGLGSRGRNSYTWILYWTGYSKGARLRGPKHLHCAACYEYDTTKGRVPKPTNVHEAFAWFSVVFLLILRVAALSAWSVERIGRGEWGSDGLSGHKELAGIRVLGKNHMYHVHMGVPENGVLQFLSPA